MTTWHAMRLDNSLFNQPRPRDETTRYIELGTLEKFIFQLRAANFELAPFLDRIHLFFVQLSFDDLETLFFPNRMFVRRSQASTVYSPLLYIITNNTNIRMYE